MAFGKLSPRSPGWWSAYGLFPHGTGIGSLLTTITKRGRVAAIAPGTSGTVLTSNGSGTAPTYQAAGSSNVTPDTHPASENTVNDEFEYGSSIDTAGNRFAGANGWTALNATDITTSVSEGNLVLSSSTAVTGIQGYTQPTAGSTWAYTAKVAYAGETAGFLYGLILGYSGKYLAFFLQSDGVESLMYWVQYASSTSAAHNDDDSTIESPQVEVPAIPVGTGGGTTGTTAYHAQYLYLQVAYNGTTVSYSVSLTGVPGTFNTVYSETSANYLGGAPTTVGLAIQGGGANQLMIVDWFRKTT